MSSSSTIPSSTGTDPSGGCPTLDASDAAELVRASREKSPARLNRLLRFHEGRGISTREILAAMANCPYLVDALGRGCRR